MTLLAVAFLIFTVVALTARARPLFNIVALLIAVSAPYGLLVALSALVLAVLARRTLLSIAAVFVVAAALAVQVPWYYFGHPTVVGQYVDVRVLSSNLRKGQADASSFVSLAEQNADVVTVSELTPESLRRFSRAGIDGVFPYAVLLPSVNAGGIGLWSRYPLATFSSDKYWNTTAAARIQIPGVRFDPLVASIHVTSPLAQGADSVDSWRNGIMGTKSQLREFADSTAPAAVIIAGDFNSTPDMREFRDLLTDGYRDAVQQTAAGYTPTFPSNTVLPPFITIDHVLTRDAAASMIRTVNLPGSDHRALLATVRVPLDPTAS